MRNPIFFGSKSPIYFEEWKSINDDRIKEIYKISNFGDVKNINSGIILTAHPIKYNHGTKPYYGYSLISKSGSPKYIHKTKHRLVMENFHPIENMDKMTVNHKNGDKSDCEDANLEWASQRENNIDAKLRGLNKNYGSNQHMAKLNEEQVTIICKYLEQGIKYSEILHLIGFDNTDNNRDMIGNIKRRIAWKHIGNKYNF